MAVFKKHDVAADMHGITEGVIWKQMLLFFFPILLGTFFQQLYNTVDAMVVGKFVGKQALAAVGGATGTLVNLIVGFFVGLSSGATVIISQYFGAREENGVSRTVHTAIAMGLGGGLILSIAGIIVSPAILRLMDTPEEVMTYATTYIRIYFAGMIPSLIYNIGSGILRAVGDSKRPLYFLICACLVNIVLDIVLVLYANMGVAGAALATIFSQAVSALLVILALLHATPALRLHWRKIRLPWRSAAAHHPHRPAGGPAVGDVFAVKPGDPEQHQSLRHGYDGYLDGLWQAGQLLLDDHQRLWRYHYHLRGAELRRA